MKTYNCDTDFEIKLKKAVEKISQYVLATFGPFGKNILIKQNGKSFLTKDGVTVANSITSQDETENAILDILKEVADRTVKDAGDGTSSSILFVKHFIEKIKSTLLAFPLIPSTKIREVFDEELRRFCRELEKYSVPVESKELLNHVAFMASNGDKLISDLVADITDQVGAAGAVSIKNSKTGKTYIEIVEGMKLKTSVASSAFLTDLQEKKTLTDCIVVISNTQISFSDDLLYLMRDCVENKKSILFVCPNMDEKALLTIISNVQRGSLQCCVISPSYLGIERLEVFEDIALTCGTTVNTTQQLNRTKATEWGYARSVEISKNMTTFIDAAAPAELLDKTVEVLRTRLQAEEDETASKRLAARIDRLTSTLGIMYVGGATEAEIIEKHHRVEDAMESCHSAMRKGVVSGGGSTLALLSDIFSQNQADSTVLQTHIRETLCFIFQQPSVLLYGGNKEFMKFDKDSKKIISVLDLRSNNFVDPIKNGLVESIWTLESALFNAFSASWLLTCCFGSIVENN